MTAVESAAKRCSTCGEVKNLAEFHRNRRMADGRHGQCKLCATASVKRSQARRRERLGEAEYLRLMTELRREYRRGQGGDYPSNRLAKAVRSEALRRLIASHQAEFDALKRLVRDEMERDS